MNEAGGWGRGLGAVMWAQDCHQRHRGYTLTTGQEDIAEIHT